jgi:hypothetical protein
MPSEVCGDSETARQSFALALQHYQLHPGTRSPALVMDGYPVPPIGEPKTFPQQDRLISFALRPLATA